MPPLLVPVPVKNHLVMFLEKEFGECYEPKKKDPLIMLIMSYLEKQTKKSNNKPPSGHAIFYVKIPISYFNRYKLSKISEDGVEELGEWFDKYFTRLMVEFVTSRLVLKDKKELIDLLAKNEKKSLIQINASIRDFLNKYDIRDEDMPFDTVKKRFQRA